MNGKFLLDTTFVIALFAEDPTVTQGLRRVDEVFVSSVVLGELYFGALKSARFETNVKRIDSFAAGNVVLTCDQETARHYGLIKSKLRARGRPLPENDIWIAATAIQHDLTLLTHDAHFGEVDGLQLEKL